MLSKAQIKRLARQLTRIAQAEPFEAVPIDRDVEALWRLLYQARVELRTHESEGQMADDKRCMRCGGTGVNRYQNIYGAWFHLSDSDCITELGQRLARLEGRGQAKPTTLEPYADDYLREIGRVAESYELDADDDHAAYTARALRWAINRIRGQASVEDGR